MTRCGWTAAMDALEAVRAGVREARSETDDRLDAARMAGAGAEDVRLAAAAAVEATSLLGDVEEALRRGRAFSRSWAGEHPAAARSAAETQAARAGERCAE